MITKTSVRIGELVEVEGLRALRITDARFGNAVLELYDHEEDVKDDGTDAVAELSEATR